MDAFKSLSSKIDDLREIEPTITRVVERLDNHIGQASRVHKEHNDAIESLKQEKWIRHGFSGAIGLISGAISTIFFHSKEGGVYVCFDQSCRLTFRRTCL